jgi:hypothetical protein
MIAAMVRVASNRGLREHLRELERRVVVEHERALGTSSPASEHGRRQAAETGADDDEVASLAGIDDLPQPVDFRRARVAVRPLSVAPAHTPVAVPLEVPKGVARSAAGEERACREREAADEIPSRYRDRVTHHVADTARTLESRRCIGGAHALGNTVPLRGWARSFERAPACEPPDE